MPLRHREHVESLRKVPIFSNLDDKHLDEVARLTTQVSEEAGAVLARQGHLGRDFVLIVDGTVRMERDGELVGRLGPGGCFGEISLIDGKPRTASVIAETPCTLLVVDRHQFMPLLETAPGLQRQVMLHLCERIREAYAHEHTH